jgi:transcriptional regulator with XRE-family HTH domain
MKTLYDRLMGVPGGARDLADARLRYEFLSVLHTALHAAGVTQAELARRLGVRKSAVNQVLRGDGNIRATTLAEYLHALGFELSIQLHEAGELRRARQEERDPRPADVDDPSSPETEAASGSYRVAAMARSENTYLVDLDPSPSGTPGHWLLRGSVHPVPGVEPGLIGNAFHGPHAGRREHGL